MENFQTEILEDSLCLDKYMASNNVRNKTVYYHTNDNCIGTEISRGKYWEPWMFDYIKKYYIPGTNMLDIGANIGTTSLMMEEVLTEGNKIHAFEPVYNNITFTNIIKNNKADRIFLYPIGLGRENKEITVKLFAPEKRDNYGGMNLMNNLIQDATECCSKKILIKKLDDFHFENVSLIKMDVEDMEMDVLLGGLETIIKNKPTIFLEIRSQMYNSIVKSEIFTKLVEVGYKLDWLPAGCEDYVLFMS